MKNTFKLMFVILAAFCGVEAIAEGNRGLIGTTYVGAMVNLTDLRTGLTSESARGATLKGNFGEIPYVDIGGSITSLRVDNAKLDINNFNGDVYVTIHKKVWFLEPYVKLGSGWGWYRLDGDRFEALNLYAGAGVEARLFKNLTVGAEATCDDVRKARSFTADRKYKAYAVFWLNDHLGVEGDWIYAQPTDNVTYTAGAVFRF